MTVTYCQPPNLSLEIPIAMDVISKIFRKHLLITNIALSVTLSGVGDVIQQKYENSQNFAIRSPYPFVHPCAEVQKL